MRDVSELVEKQTDKEKQMLHKTEEHLLREMILIDYHAMLKRRNYKAGIKYPESVRPLWKN
jgi:hypothetical protein